MERHGEHAARSSVRDEHRHLGSLMRRTREALSGVDGNEQAPVDGSAREAVRELSEALEAHFEQED